MPVESVSLFETDGFSMWPFLRPRQRLIIKRVPIKDLKTGDIILYQTDNQSVCHRLVKRIKNKERYLLYARGDNSISSPELVTEQMFLGKAVAILKNDRIISLIGRVQQFINQITVIVSPLFAIGIRISKLLLRKR